MFAKIKGTQDILDHRLLDEVIKLVTSHAQFYNFTQISTPILESVTLFERGLGLQTDVVSKEMFLVESKSDREKICLRPEMTAGAVRAFLEQQGSLVLPWKIFSYGPAFRYERPQKGRLRQFHQISFESLGTADISYDALFISMLDQLFGRILQIAHYQLRINFLGTIQDRQIFKEHLYQFLEKHNETICSTCQERKITNILRVFDCKNSICQQIYQSAPVIINYLTEQSIEQWNLLQEYLVRLGVQFVIDPYLVRGLDYYNKTVFEFISLSLGAQNTFCGGGRYDSLAQQLGSKDQIPSIGAGIGVERLLMVLEDKKDAILVKQQPLIIVISCDTAQNSSAIMYADRLQKAGIKIDILVDAASLKSKLRKADKLQADYAIVIGSIEQQEGFVMVKDMKTGVDIKVLQKDLCDYFKNM